MFRRAWVLLALCAACGADENELLVDVRTDLVPGHEFASVRTVVLLGEGEREAANVTTAVDRTLDYRFGARVLDLPGVTDGPVALRVALLDETGAEVLSRRVRTEIRGTTAVTVVFSRTCIAVSCPGATDDPGATECVGARCVPPECTVDNPGACGTAVCTADADCASAVACARPVCAEGACLSVPDDAVCGSETYCHPTRGCVAERGDGGVDADGGAAPDAGGPIDGGIDAGPADAGTDAGPAIDAGPPPECTGDGDCPADSFGAWTACGGYADTCDESGTRSRGVTRFACTGGSCVPSTDTETGSCMRDTDGSSCGTTMYGTWGPCGGFSGTCDESGTRSRSVTTYACAAGACAPSVGSDTGSCSRVTDGTTCAATEYGTWGSCGGFAGTCDESGTRSRSMTTHVCGGGTCGSSSGTDTGACSRDTDGTSCGGGFTCNVFQCVTGSCQNLGDSCGTGHCCGDTCYPMGTFCP